MQIGGPPDRPGRELLDGRGEVGTLAQQARDKLRADLAALGPLRVHQSRACIPSHAARAARRRLSRKAASRVRHFAAQVVRRIVL